MLECWRKKTKGKIANRVIGKHNAPKRRASGEGIKQTS